MNTEDGYFIQKCLNGESEAFGFLVDKYKASVYYFLLSRLRNVHDAEDVSQKVFLRAYERLGHLRRWESFAKWLYSIAYTQCRNFIRERQNRPDSEYFEEQDYSVMITRSMDSYYEDQANESLKETVDEALNSLPEMYREVLVMHYIGGMKNKDIAVILGTSIDNIKQRLSRARSMLKEEVIAMMSVAYDQQKLTAKFTFNVMETIKKLKIQPISTTKGVPWGLSLATGLIIAIMSINPTLISFTHIGTPIYAPLPSETKVLKIGEIPVDVMKTSNITILSSNMGKGNGLGLKPDMQNAFFMAPQGEGNTWSQMANMDAPRLGHGICPVNGKLYAFGGIDIINEDARWITTIDEYDPKLNKWIKKLDMPNLVWFGYTALNGKIYIIGGQTPGNGTLTTNYEYDPLLNTWTEKAKMPTGRAFAGVSTVNGKIYVIGGWIGWNVDWTGAVEEYDPLADKWTKKADKPKPTGAFCVASTNNKIYVFDGCDDNGPTQTIYEYDPMIDSWKRKDSKMPTFRASMSACESNGKIYVIGGCNDNINGITTVEEYDPKLDRWKKKEDMPTKRMLSAITSLDGKIYVAGGSQKIENGSYASVVSTFEEYTPEGWQSQSISPQDKLPNTWGKLKAK